MILQRIHCLFISALLAMVLPSMAVTVTANFTTVATVPVTAASYTVTGNTVSLSLGFTPPTGTDLMVVKNTGLGFITGRFSNLAQGQVVNLTYNGVTYKYVANYYGGTGNDLVLHWAYQDLATWGYNSGTLTVSGALANNGNLLTTTGSGSSTFSGNITGVGGLLKTGSGTTTLSGTANVYSGQTTVSAGTLSMTGKLTTGTNTTSLVTIGNSNTDNAVMKCPGTLTAGQTTAPSLSVASVSGAAGDFQISVHDI
ncbi:MAG: autotransporter-associated beta strand repeat-containing protein [Verrucomicrobiota bacterium]